MTAEQIQASRRALSAFRTEFERFKGIAANVGSAAAKSFGKNFKSIAVFTVRELARGALPAIGQKIVENWGKTGHKTGKAFGGRMKKAAAAELKSMSSGGGGGLSVGGLLKFTGITAAAGAAAATVASSFTAAMEQEKITISLDALAGSGGGARIFEEVRKDALRTGVEVGEQAKNIQKMMSQGMDETTALDLNRAMLDIAGGTGLTTDEIGLLGNALSQVKGKGVAAMEELRGQIAEKGVPIFEALRQKFGAEDITAVFDMISAGQVSADDVINTFKDLEGPFAKFAGASDRLGKTGGGLFARLVEHATDLKRVFATEVMPELKPVLEYAIGLIEKMKSGAKAFGVALGEALGTAQAAFQALSFAEMFSLAGLALKEKLLDALDFGARGVAAIMAALSDGDSFGKMLEMAALRFKSAMLSAVSEILHAMEAALPEGGRMALAVGAAANQSEIRGNIAADDADRLKRSGAITPGEMLATIQKEFKNAPSMFGLSEGDKTEMERLLQKITSQRAANVAGQGPAEPVLAGGGAPAGGGGTKGAIDPSGMLAGGLANAISRITGGGDIIMNKQLAVQEATKVAAEATKVAAEKTQIACETLAKNSNPRNRPMAATLQPA